MVIEQAIFTSTESATVAGYHLAATSPGITEQDARELAQWGPSHDSLAENGPAATSVNFHRLPSGAFCVSKTSSQSGEYSARGGHCVYTQCLVVPRETLGRFNNNPFALLNAAFAQGSLCVHDEIPRTLEPFRLGGKAAPVDATLLAQLSADPGADWLAELIAAALSTPALAVLAPAPRERLIAGFINCLPPECRCEFSFATGLKFSPTRPFRILALPEDSTEKNRTMRGGQMRVLDMLRDSPDPPTTGWAGFIAAALASGRTSFLASQLARRRDHLTMHDLNNLGEQLRHQMMLTAPAARPVPVVAPTDTLTSAAPSTDSDRALDRERDQPGDEEGRHRADAPHVRRNKDADARARGLYDSPVDVLGSKCPDAVEQLGLLDDVVFEAIAGRAGALARLKTLWPQVKERVGPRLVEESREEYVRHALEVWRDCVRGDEVRNPALAVTALEVVSVLFDG
ncbi:MAG: hypothetical protein HYX69_14140 [Planctomycetia bacterium]|nr:hypothetical protein [Planctomycetia bacterium]